LKRSVKTREITLVALFVVLTTVGGWFKIPIFPVPITFQTFFVLLSGFALGPFKGALSQILYLVLGLMGLPVFAHGGGIGYFLQPTFGYLLGFIFAALVTGLLFQYFQPVSGAWSMVRAVGFNFIGVLLISLTGVGYLYLNLNFIAGSPVSFGKVFVSGFLLFLPADLIKIIILTFLEKLLVDNHASFLSFTK
jgi:biotin transport system substrate-specific component